MPPPPSPAERFLRAVERLGVVPEVELRRIRKGRQGSDDPADSARIAQELLKRSQLTPKQVAEVQRALRESQEVVPEEPEPEGEDSERSRARTETQVRPDMAEAETLELVRRRRGSKGPAVGELVGERFRLDLEIGGGSQGVVYRAHDTTLNRDVAVKVLRTDSPGGQARARFEREAKLVSQLGHSGIVTIIEMGETERGLLYYAMELVAGRSLEEVLDEEGPLAVPRAERIVEGVALAIHHAHEAGLVHRDLKPGNVLLDEDETPKVADFGLVTLAEGTRLTQTRAVVGTPVYMAPEQAEGERIDRRADVYSLGALLYECLVGRPPFDGATPLEIFRKVVRDRPPPPRSLRPDLPALVEEVCLRALEKEPRARYPTAAAFARDLRRALEGDQLAPRRPAPVLRRHLERTVRFHPFAVGVVLGLSLGVGLTLGLVGDRRPGAPAAVQPDPPDPGRLERRAQNRKKLIKLARAERARGLEQAAVDWLRTLGDAELERDPTASRDVARARALEALACLGLERPGDARRALAQAILLEPGLPLVAVAQAALHRRQGDLRRADRLITRVLNRAPLLVEAHLERAFLANLRDEPQRALEALDRAIELTEPRPWAVALQVRCLVLRTQGKVQHALWDVERLLELTGRGKRLGQVGLAAPDANGARRRLDALVAAVDSRVVTAARSGLRARAVAPAPPKKRDF